MAWGMTWVYINYTVLNNTWPGQAPALAWNVFVTVVAVVADFCMVKQDQQ